jgi:hypothetical protein
MISFFWFLKRAKSQYFEKVALQVQNSNVSGSQNRDPLKGFQIFFQGRLSQGSQTQTGLRAALGIVKSQRAA